LFNNGASNSDNLLSYAIRLVNSTGNVESNNITDDGYIYGIGISGSGSLAYLCNNYITTVETGIKSDNYGGYVKLCQINTEGEGYESGVNDEPAIVFSSIIGC